MDYSLMFYVATVCHKFLVVDVIAATLLTAFCIISFIAKHCYEEDDEDKNYLKIRIFGKSNQEIVKTLEEIEEFYKSKKEIVTHKINIKALSILALILWILVIIIPSKNDVLLIVCGGKVLNYITNDSTLNEIPNEASTLILNELKNLNKENDDNDSTSLNTMLNINEETK